MAVKPLTDQAGARAGNRRSGAVSATWVWTRASAAPRQKCGPWA
jgi:hypothetical protein